MKAKPYVLALVTAPDLKTARRLAKSVLKARLAACINMVPRVESHYWWNGQIESEREVLMILKTTSRAVRALEKLIVNEHPYEAPEFIAFSIFKGNQRYLDWIAGSVA